MTTLADDKRQATVDRILLAGRQVLITLGPDATMDEIAATAGMSRRTLFRHFESRDSLLAAALRSGMRRYGERLPPYEGGDWAEWLDALCQAVHQNYARFGAGFFELVARRDLTGELAEVEAKRKRNLLATMKDLSATLWTAAGGAGQAPPAVVASVAAHLSVFFTAAVTMGTGHDWHQAADLASTSIAAVVREALAEAA